MLRISDRVVIQNVKNSKELLRIVLFATSVGKEGEVYHERKMVEGGKVGKKDEVF